MSKTLYFRLCIYLWVSNQTQIYWDQQGGKHHLHLAHTLIHNRFLSQRDTSRAEQRHSAINTQPKTWLCVPYPNARQVASTNELHSINWQIRTCSLLSRGYEKTSTRINTAPVIEQQESSWQNQTCDSLGQTQIACNKIKQNCLNFHSTF